MLHALDERAAFGAVVDARAGPFGCRSSHLLDEPAVKHAEHEARRHRAAVPAGQRDRTLGRRARAALRLHRAKPVAPTLDAHVTALVGHGARSAIDRARDVVVAAGERQVEPDEHDRIAAPAQRERERRGRDRAAARDPRLFVEPVEIQSSSNEFAPAVRYARAPSSNSEGWTVAALTRHVRDRSQPAK